MSIIKDKTLGLFVKTNGMLSRPLYGGKGLILMFHRVRPVHLMSAFEQNRLWEVTPEHLENVVIYFKKKKYRIISSSEIPNALETNSKEPFVVFTFDDGYHDNIDYAYPVFAKHKLPLSIFITTSYITCEKFPWEFMLEDYLMSRDSFTIESEGETQHLRNATEIEKHQNYNSLYKVLKTGNNPSALNKTIKHVFGQFADTYKNKVSLISKKELSELASDQLVDLGLHGDGHYVFSQLKNQQIHDELQICIEKFKQTTGFLPKGLAYPYGGINDINLGTVNSLQEFGITYALTTYPGNCFSKTNRFLLPRYAINMKTDEKELDYMTNGIRHFSYNGFSRQTVMEKTFLK